MALLLGIDLGTSYFKVGLFDPAGALKGLGRVAVDARTSAPGRVELPVPVFWERLRRALGEALAQAGASAREIVGASYSSQANTFVLLDANDAPLTPLVLWPDRRASPVDQELAAFGQTPAHGATTGLVGVVPERAPVKWRWFARHEPAVWSRTRWAMTVSDFLIYALTGEPAGDGSTAALTGLYSLPERTWWAEALAVFGVEREKLSQPLAPGSVCGRTVSRATELLGLAPGIPFAVGALDHHAAALGSGIGALADASLSTGTVLAVLVLVDDVRPTPGCIHGPLSDGKRFYRLAFNPAGAGQLEDYQGQYARGLSIETLLELAENSAGGGNRDAPVPIEHGVAVLDILNRIVTTQHGLLQQVAGATAVRKIAATGGGARSPFWLQLTANRLGVPLVTSECLERGCLGAALFAGVAAGSFADLAEAARAMVRPSREYVPGGGVGKS